MIKLSPPYKGCAPNKITQGFSLKNHEAVDVAGSFGVFLVAPFDAKVIAITQAQRLDESTKELQNGCGLLMTAVDDPSYRVVYWHCLPAGFTVEPGDVVRKGYPVAQMGNTGMVYGDEHFYSVEERMKEYSESTPTYLPKKGVHVHISMGIGDGTADGTTNVDWRNYVDWNYQIIYDPLTAIKAVLQKISNLLNNK